MKRSSNTKGYSLVEVLVAVAILMFSIIGPLTIASKSLQSAQYAKQQNTAFFLAQEGISAVNALRNDAGLGAVRAGTNPWSWVTTPTSTLVPCFNTTGCNIDFRDSSLYSNIINCASSATACTLRFTETSGRSVYRLSVGAATPYRRIITLRRIGANEVIVQSRVEWSSTVLGGIQNVTLTTSLFNIYK